MLRAPRGLGLTVKPFYVYVLTLKMNQSLCQNIGHINPISAGGGVFRTPSHFEASQDPLNVLQISSNFLRIPIYLFTNKISKKNLIFWGGAPLSPP